MRQRTFDLIDAYLARVPGPLVDLHCRWKVDYLVVDRTLLSGDAARLSYFEPFDEKTRALLETAGGSRPILRDTPVEAVVFESGAYQVVDLAALSGGTACASEVAVP